jgi:hypothetical protein
MRARDEPAVHQADQRPEQESGDDGGSDALCHVEHNHRNDPDNSLRGADAQVDLSLQDDDDHAEAGDRHEGGISRMFVMFPTVRKTGLRELRTPHSSSSRARANPAWSAWVSFDRRRRGIGRLSLAEPGPRRSATRSPPRPNGSTAQSYPE